ncbi:DUF4955 domain-containing protein [Hallella bergensis]|uniref:DUF4955 domain-containing protein n=1 Tax=Hallella bergensis TaxID=242750 RepID=UPI0023F0FE3D|nr:DUF4955 domain-containing protein [Hallella bergensis]
MRYRNLLVSILFTTTLPLMADGGVSNTAIAWQEFVNSSPNNVLLDFSFAGYKHGEEAPADVYTLGYTVYDVTKYGLDGTDDRSDRDAFDKLVSDINNKARKNGGQANAIIYFPAGRYILHTSADNFTNSAGKSASKTINIVAGNLIIKGAGRDKTQLVMQDPNLPKDPNKMWTSPTMISIRNNGEKLVPVWASVTADAPKGSFEVSVDDTKNIHVGDWVTLHLKNNDRALIDKELSGQPLYKNMRNLIDVGVQVIDYHQVAAVDNGKVTFKEPLMHAVESQYGWTIQNYKCFENVGVEDLTFVGNAKPDFKHHGSWEDDGAYKPLDMIRLANSWVRRVAFHSVSEALTFTWCANCSAYDILITGNRGHSAIRSQGSSRVFIGKVGDYSDGIYNDTRNVWGKCVGQYHACGVSKQSIGTVVWNCTWGVDACFEAHATQPRATLIDACRGGLMQLRCGGDKYQLPNHLDDLTLWNLYVTNTSTQTLKMLPYRWWDNNNIWIKILPPTIVGLHGDYDMQFDDGQTKRDESHGKAVFPRSLYAAQLERRLGKMPDWLVDLEKADHRKALGKTWILNMPTEQDKEAFEEDSYNNSRWEKTTDTANNLVFQNTTAIGTPSNAAVEAKDVSQYAGKLIADGKEAEFTRGLLFCIYVPETNLVKPVSPGKLLVYTDPERQSIRLNAKNLSIVVPHLKAGQTVEVGCRSVTNAGIRFLNAYNLTIEQGFGTAASSNLEEQICIGKVEQNGDVVIGASNGIYVYSITVKDENGDIVAGVGNPAGKFRQDDSKIYNLLGQNVGTRFDLLRRGTYICNGKKVMK